MLLQFSVSITGPAGAFAPGDTAEWPDEQDAARLIAAGFASPVLSEKFKENKRETAAAVLNTTEGKAYGRTTPTRWAP